MPMKLDFILLVALKAVHARMEIITPIRNIYTRSIGALWKFHHRHQVVTMKLL